MGNEEVCPACQKPRKALYVHHIIPQRFTDPGRGGKLFIWLPGVFPEHFPEGRNKTERICSRCHREIDDRIIPFLQPLTPEHYYLLHQLYKTNKLQLTSALLTTWIQESAEEIAWRQQQADQRIFNLIQFPVSLSA